MRVSCLDASRLTPTASVREGRSSGKLQPERARLLVVTFETGRHRMVQACCGGNETRCYGRPRVVGEEHAQQVIVLLSAVVLALDV